MAASAAGNESAEMSLRAILYLAGQTVELKSGERIISAGAGWNDFFALKDEKVQIMLVEKEPKWWQKMPRINLFGMVFSISS